jgi:hypothetical protein
MKQVSSDDFNRLHARSSYKFDDNNNYPRLDFSFREKQNFLNKKGYDVFVHKVLQNQRGWNSNDISYEIPNVQIEVIIAVKPGDVLPERWESREDIVCSVDTVFLREMKEKLLDL